MSHSDDRWNSLYCIWKERWFPSVIGGSDRPISGRALQTKSFFHKWHSHRRFRPLTVPGALKQARCFRKEACCSERSSGLLWQERKMWVNAKRADFPYRLSYSVCVCVHCHHTAQSYSCSTATCLIWPYEYRNNSWTQINLMFQI